MNVLEIFFEKCYSCFLMKTWVSKRTYFWTYGSAFCVICCSFIHQTNLYRRNESLLIYIIISLIQYESYFMTHTIKVNQDIMSNPLILFTCKLWTQIFRVDRAWVETVGLDIKECVDFQCSSLRDNEPHRKAFIHAFIRVGRSKTI